MKHQRQQPDDEFRDEADRLAQLPRGDQEAVVAMYRHLCSNPLATKACRDNAEHKAEALARMLGLAPAPAGKASARTRPKRGKESS